MTTTCFVIGPIGQANAEFGTPGRTSYESALELYENVIVGACAQLGIEAVRADQIATAGDITDQIFRRLYESDIVIADVSGGNANVMYELGLRHSLNELTIQIADEDTSLPFDIKAVRTIMVKRTEYGLIKARNVLVEAIRLGLQGKPHPVAATRIWNAAQHGELDEISSILNSIAPVKDQEDEDEDGFLEIVMSLADAFEEPTRTTQNISECILEISVLTQDSQKDLNRLSAIDAPMASRLTAIHQFSHRLLDKTMEFETLTIKLKSDLEGLDTKVSPLLRYLAENAELRKADNIAGFFSAIEGLASQARGSLDGLGQFAAAAKQLGGLSKSLRRPGALIAASVARMTDTVSLIEDWDFAVKQIRAFEE